MKSPGNLRRMFIAAAVLLLVGLSSALLAGEFPKRLLVQGALGPSEKDNGGGVVREMDMVFTIESEDGAAVFFSELHCGVPVIGLDGRFEVVLGSVDPAGNPVDLLFDLPYWLGVTVCTAPAACGGPAPDPALCTDPELMRTQIEPNAYAHRARYASEADHAKDADNLGGFPPDHYLDVTTVFDGDVTGPYNNLQIKPGVVGTPEIANAAVTNAKLQNSSVTVAVGTGLSGGGAVALGAATTLSIRPCASGEIL